MTPRPAASLSRSLSTAASSSATPPAPADPVRASSVSLVLAWVAGVVLAVAAVLTFPALAKWWPAVCGLLVVTIGVGYARVLSTVRARALGRIWPALSDVLGVPVAGQVRWSRGGGGQKLAARFRGAPSSVTITLPKDAFGDVELPAKVASATAEVWPAVLSKGKTRFEVRHTQPRRGRVVLAPVTDTTRIGEETIKDRVAQVTSRVFGSDARAGEFRFDGPTLQQFTIRHSRSAKLTSTAIQREVTRVVSEQLPGRWRGHFDLSNDVVTMELRPTLPRKVDRPTTAISPGDPHFDEIPQAVDEDGNVCYWGFSGPMAHQLKAGRTRTGKTVSLIGDAVEASRRGMRVFVCDPKRVEFLGLRDWPNVVLVATTVQDQVAMLYLLYQMMMDRYRSVEEDGVSETDFDHVFLLLDEYRIFYAAVNEWWASIKVTGMPAKCPALEWVGALLRMAAAARIHVILGTQRPDAEFLGGEARDNFSSRGATGPLSPDGARMMFDDHSVGTTIPYGLRGRGTWVGEDGHPKEVQYFYTPDPRKATSTSDKTLLSALRPPEVTWPRQRLLYPELDDDQRAAKVADAWLEVQNCTLVDYKPTAEELSTTTQPELEPEPSTQSVDDDSTAALDTHAPADHVDPTHLAAGDLVQLDDAWVTLVEPPVLLDNDTVALDWISDDNDAQTLVGADELLWSRRVLH